MSAYKEFEEIQFPSAAILIEALKELGFEPEVGKSLVLHGYRGDERPERCQIRVDRKQLGRSSNDLGFAWNGKAFVPIISEYDAKVILTAEWREKLELVYGKMAVLKWLSGMKARVRGMAQPQDGSIVIRATVEV